MSFSCCHRPDFGAKSGTVPNPNSVSKKFETLVRRNTHAHTRRLAQMRAVVPALLGLLGIARGLGCALVLPAGRVVHHQMAETARKNGDIDMPAVFATLLAAFHQQQQRSVAAWDLIMEDFEDDLELDTEDDEAARVVKRRRVYPRKDYTKSG